MAQLPDKADDVQVSGLHYKQMSKEAMKLALEAHKKNERHNTVAETRYWCGQYKLLAEQALAQPEQNLNCKSVQARLAASWGYVKAQPDDLMIAYMSGLHDGKKLAKQEQGERQLKISKVAA